MTWRDGVRISDAQEAAIAGAKAAEAAAFERVDFVRGEFALGRVDRGDVAKAQRKLAIAQEATELAKAKVRAVARDTAAAAAAEIERREIERRALVAQLVPERESLEGEVAAVVAIFLEELDGLAPRLIDWTARAERAQPPRGRLTGVLPGSLGALTNPGTPLMNARAAARLALSQLTTRRN